MLWLCPYHKHHLHNITNNFTDVTDACNSQLMPILGRSHRERVEKQNTDNGRTELLNHMKEKASGDMKCFIHEACVYVLVILYPQYFEGKGNVDRRLRKWASLLNSKYPEDMKQEPNEGTNFSKLTTLESKDVQYTAGLLSSLELTTSACKG